MSRVTPGAAVLSSGTGSNRMFEASDYMTAGRAMLGLDDGKGDHLPMWLIFDQTYQSRYLFAASVLPRAPIPKVFYESGVVVKADAIEELADKIGVPGLVEGAARFNVLANQGQDDDFQRGLGHYDRYYGDPTQTPNPNLGPITQPPFYPVVPADLGTCGGITADERGRALRDDGTPIEGLYAIGNAAANAFGTFYPGPGATNGQGVVFAYLAALDAVERARAERRAHNELESRPPPESQGGAPAPASIGPVERVIASIPLLLTPARSSKALGIPAIPPRAWRAGPSGIAHDECLPQLQLPMPACPAFCGSSHEDVVTPPPSECDIQLTPPGGQALTPRGAL